MAYETRNGSIVRTGRKAAARARTEYFATRLNRYTCQTCSGYIITVDREEGVTPFALECRATKDCQGDMYSSFYRDVHGVPTYEWRKPMPAEYARMSPAMRDHVDKGGLDIYPIEQPAQRT
jgi:hypothetical protein